MDYVEEIKKMLGMIKSEYRLRLVYRFVKGLLD